MRPWLLPLLVLILGSACSAAQGREWTDSTGHFKVEATLVAFDDRNVVLMRTDDRQLLSLPIEDLSKADQDHLKSKEAREIGENFGQRKQSWQLEGGATLVGRVVDYGRRVVVIQARRGNIYVNDRRFDNLPGIYQQLVLRIVSRFDGVEVKDKEALVRWAARQKGQPREFTVDGVLLELEDGDVYGVPFFVFSEQDRRILEPGWKSWLAAQQDSQLREQEVLALQALAESYQRDRQVDDQARRLQLQLLASISGVTSLWEVWMAPGPRTAGPPLAVVVPGVNSRDAAVAAQQAHPGYVAGPVRKLN